MDFFEKSGRKNAFGPSMFRSTDRYNREYALGPTHEELFAFMSMSRVKSYRDLPYTLYQIGTKFRDEVRPRLGLIRVREFTMKDAYSLRIFFKKMLMISTILKMIPFHHSYRRQTKVNSKIIY